MVLVGLLTPDLPAFLVGMLLVAAGFVAGLVALVRR